MMHYGNGNKKSRYISLHTTLNILLYTGDITIPAKTEQDFQIGMHTLNQKRLQHYKNSIKPNKDISKK